MSLLLLPICYFLRNGVTVDDLGLILVGGAVIFLMRFLATRLIIPAVRLNLNILVGGVPGRAVRDIEDPAVLAPDPEEDDFM